MEQWITCIAVVVVMGWVLYDRLVVERKKNNESMRRIAEKKEELMRIRQKYEKYDPDSRLVL